MPFQIPCLGFLSAHGPMHASTLKHEYKIATCAESVTPMIGVQDYTPEYLPEATSVYFRPVTSKNHESVLC